MILDRHTVALISIVGSSLDVLGAMYLAYDLLGGEHGPLRTLTRGVTYGVLFGTGYGIGMGAILLIYGLVNISYFFSLPINEAVNAYSSTHTTGLPIATMAAAMSS